MSAFTRLNIEPFLLARTQKYSSLQGQTGNAFGFQWSKRESYESDAVKENSRAWLFQRYCNNDERLLKKWLAGGRKIILDAGCGSGFSALLFFGKHLKNHDYLGVDISQAVEIAQVRFREAGFPGDFLQMDITSVPIPEGSVDMIFSEGVLHHTDNTERSLKSVAKYLKKGGRFLFYVYAKKGVIREFTDDYIRQQLAPLSDQEAWDTLYPLTKLGQALGELNLEIDIQEDIPFLGIKKGKVDVQRFFYWNICKVFYRSEYTLEEMNHMNFDWFRPLNCHRHTPEEIRKWCSEAGLKIEHIAVEQAGITVVAIKS